MIGLGRQAGILAIARLANYALMLLSPVILVRLLDVTQFGHYREFLLYASFLQLLAAFTFSESLLYFVAAYSRSPWRMVRQTVVLGAITSFAVAALLAILDKALHGVIVGEYLWPLIAYVLLFVNLDFWEHFFLATHRPGAVFAYSGVRLMARMLTVIIAAAVTGKVAAIIWSLVALEAFRLCVALIAWRSLDKSDTEPPIGKALHEQLRYCIPAGLGMLVFMLNRNLGNFVVAKVLGAVALAHYAIGTYGEYVYLAIGNSLSAVLLPEMVRRDGVSSGSGTALWRKTTVIYCLLMFPVAILVARYAEPIILSVFSERYRPAIIVLQIHMLFLIRACFDFSPALRSINRTRPLVYSNLCALAVNALCIWLLVGSMGIAGVVSALVISGFVEALVLGQLTVRLYGSSWAEFIPWKPIGKVALAAFLASVVLIPSLGADLAGLGKAMVASMLYLCLFFLGVRLLRVSELGSLEHRVRDGAASILNRVRSMTSIIA